jgi:hypothetical protein
LTKSLTIIFEGGASGPQALTLSVHVPAAPQHVLIAHTESAGQSLVAEQGSPQLLGVAQAPLPSVVSMQKQALLGLQLKLKEPQTVPAQAGLVQDPESQTPDAH